MTDGPFILLLALVVFPVVYVYLKDQVEAEDPLARARATALLQLRRFKLEGPSPELSINGRTAEIHITTEDIRHSDYGPSELQAIHYYLRNPAGEYFYVLVRTSDKVFGKHITHAAARAVLKNKYVPPDARSTGKTS